MPSKESTQLQHSREFVEKQNATVVRQAPVAKADFYVSRRSTHTDFNITKSDVKVTTNICNGSPVKSARDSHLLSVFTPDIGHRLPIEPASAGCSALPKALQLPFLQ